MEKSFVNSDNLPQYSQSALYIIIIIMEIIQYHCIIVSNIMDHVSKNKKVDKFP